ncbi:putative RNA methyltransferase [Sporolactobacillus sp. KGMB 08714]|uniref:putative RNA methyltransferase n=1 Tax=Sporolactobacillus sp. KGMB 08714 TaxID=3064704 RepID=UPI002FBE99B2
MTKRVESAAFVSGLDSIFKCPVCGSSMKVFESKSLICSNRHTFDFTKQGYVNLMTHSLKTKYDKELFEARRKLIEKEGFFGPLEQSIAETIKKQLRSKKGTTFILDTGCGEGSHLYNICDSICTDLNSQIAGVGIDISKEGISIAAKNYAGKVWAVADLANVPFKDKQFDVILNILSPANYGEFNRLLKADGLLIKVIPESDYLKELREVVFDEPAKQSYSNANTRERFKENFQVVSTSRLHYSRILEKPSIQSLIRMTPLTWSMTQEKVKSFSEMESMKITIDLDILVGKPFE